MPRYDRQLERNLVPMQHLGAAATASQRKAKYANAAECPGFQYDPVFGFQGLCGVCKFPKAKHPGDVAYKSPLARKKPRQNRMSVARRISMAARKNKAFHFSDDEMASDEEETGDAAARFSLPIVVVEEEVKTRNDGQLESSMARTSRRSRMSSRKSDTRTSKRRSRMSLRRSRASKRAEAEIPAAAPLSARGRGYTEDGGEDDTIYDRLDTKFSDMYSTISKSSLPRDTDFNTESDEHNSEEDVREDEEEEEEEVVVAAPPPPPILKKKNRVSNSMRESRRESCIRGSILREPVADAPRRVSRVTWLDETPAEIIQDVAADSDANTDDEEEALRAAAEQPASGKRMSARQSMRRKSSRASLARQSQRGVSNRLSVVRESEEDEAKSNRASQGSMRSSRAKRMSAASGIVAAVPVVVDQDGDDDDEEEEEMDGTKSVPSRLSRQSSASKRTSRRSSSRRSARQEPLDDLDEASEEDDTDTMPKSSRLSAASKRSSRRSEQHDRDEEEEEDADDAALAGKSVSRMSMRRSTASRSSRRSSKARDDDNDDNKRSSRRSARSSRRSRKSSRRLAGDVDNETARLSAIREEEEEEDSEEEDSEDASEEEDFVYGGAERSRSSKRSGRSSTRSSTRSSSSRDKDGKAADAGSASHKLLKSAAISTARSSGDSSGRSSLVTSVSRDQSRRDQTSFALRAASEHDSGSEQEDEEEEEEESSPREEEASEEEEDEGMFAEIEFDERDPSEDFENYFDWAGRPCRALFHDNEEFYPATILDYEGDKLFTVQFAKGTTQKETELNDIQLVDRDNPLLAPIEAREDDIGFDSLADACRAKDATAVLAFLQRGEAPDEVDSNNETPLSIASMLGDINSAKILLQFGAMDMDGSALAKAANQDFRDFLITYGLGKAHPRAQCIQREGGDFDVLRRHLSAGASSRSRGRTTMRRLSPRGSSWPRIARTSHSASESSASSTSSTLKKMLCMNNGGQ